MLIKKEDVTSFAMWLTGHDKETVDKLFDNFNNSRERKESVPTEPLDDKLLLSEIRKHYLVEIDINTGEPKADMKTLMNLWDKVNKYLEIKTIG